MRRKERKGRKKGRRSLRAPRFPPLHELQAPGEVRLQTELGPQESARLFQPLDVPSDLPRWILAARGRESQAHDIQHAVVESVVEVGAAAGVGVVVPTFVAAVGVEVPAELDDEFEGEGGAAGEGGEVFDGGDELREGAGECGGGEVRGEGVLEAVEVVVEDGHFAVELVVEGLGGGGIAVHCVCNRWRHVWWESVRCHMRPIGTRLTSSETALVDPGVHVCALILQLLELICGVFELVL